MLGYKALVSRLVALWPNTGGFLVTDLHHGNYLVRVRSESAAEFVLTQGP